MPGTETKGDDGWGYSPVDNSASEGMPTYAYHVLVERCISVSFGFRVSPRIIEPFEMSFYQMKQYDILVFSM